MFKEYPGDTPQTKTAFACQLDGSKHSLFIAYRVRFYTYLA